MNRKRDAAAMAKERHQAPIDADDMIPVVEGEAPETDAIEDDGEPLGGNFA